MDEPITKAIHKEFIRRMDEENARQNHPIAELEKELAQSQKQIKMEIIKTIVSAHTGAAVAALLFNSVFPQAETATENVNASKTVNNFFFIFLFPLLLYFINTLYNS